MPSLCKVVSLLSHSISCWAAQRGNNFAEAWHRICASFATSGNGALTCIVSYVSSLHAIFTRRLLNPPAEVAQLDVELLNKVAVNSKNENAIGRGWPGDDKGFNTTKVRCRALGGRVLPTCGTTVEDIRATYALFWSAKFDKISPKEH